MRSDYKEFIAIRTWIC